MQGDPNTPGGQPPQGPPSQPFYPSPQGYPTQPPFPQGQPSPSFPPPQGYPSQPFPYQQQPGGMPPPQMPPARPSGFSAAVSNFRRLPLVIRILLSAVAFLVVCSCIGIAASAGSSNNKTANATATSVPQAQAPTATSSGPKPTATDTPIRPTATDTPIKPTATPKPTDQDYTDWLNNEVEALEGVGIIVLESLYPNGSHNIIWIRVAPMSHDGAKSWACLVASDYVDHFHTYVTVHFYGPAGLDDELANCSDGP